MTTATTSVLITGATTGIGRTTALHLSSRGFRVIATGRNQAALSSLRDEASAVPPTAGGSLTTLRLDVTDAASIQAAATEIDLLTGGRGVDVVVNNAGYGMAAPLSETTDAELRAQYETNVFGLMAVTRAFLPQMMARRSGRIINVSSIGGRITFPLFGAYNSSKYAVESLSDALRNELLPFGIRVVVIEPGPIRTEFSTKSFDSVNEHRSDTSPYAQVYARADKLKATADAQSAGPLVVARTIERAITRRRPRARYVTPFSSRILVGLLERLPTRWVDAAMRAVVGLSSRRLQLPARTLTPMSASPPQVR